MHLIGAPVHTPPEQALEDRIEAKLTEQEAVFDAGALRTVALEQTAGEMSPDEALAVAREMVARASCSDLGGRADDDARCACSGGGDRATLRPARPARRPGCRRACEDEREQGGRGAHRRTAVPRAGAGPAHRDRPRAPGGARRSGRNREGCRDRRRRRAEQIAGRETIGIAVSGSTAERLGADSPALAGRTLTLDALVARADTGRVQIGAGTTVILDEAGMVDHKRMDALTELIERSGAKLIAVGDGKQLPSIGPGGMFDRIAGRAPTAELTDVRRTSDPEERKAWAALRAGEPERAMAHYQARGQLFFNDSRDEAGEAAVQRWAELTKTRDIRDVALIADASNVEIDRLNARAQHLRAERGELGQAEVPLPHQHYGLREGDLIAFTKQHRTPGEPRVENGARGQVTDIHDTRGVTVALDGSQRQVTLAGEDLESLRLGYAQHVYRQQGATVERSVVVTGGWQTSKESAYVQASRARQGHRVVPRPRRARPRRAGRAASHEPRQQDEKQPRPHTITRAPRTTRPRLGEGLQADARPEPQPPSGTRAHHPPHRPTRPITRPRPIGSAFLACTEPGGSRAPPEPTVGCIGATDSKLSRAGRQALFR